ncbi:MAG: QueT transporter family protein [Clostridia bacterium]|nr:QueT transporter family protein [Clostridia bacterium]
MKNQRRKATVYLVQGALIAAIYAALTYFLQPIAFGAQQLRVSEALTILPALTPAAIPGLTVGCIIANLSSPYGLVDIVLGSVATLLASICTRLTRNIKLKNIPWLSPIFPVLFNAIIIGLEISYFLPDGISWTGFVASALSVGIGELIVCYVLGLPLYAALDRTKIFR